MSQIQNISEPLANCAGGAGWSEAMGTPEAWLLLMCSSFQSCKHSLKTPLSYELTVRAGRGGAT
jgi:hypothetical protein